MRSDIISFMGEADQTRARARDLYGVINEEKKKVLFSYIDDMLTAEDPVVISVGLMALSGLSQALIDSKINKNG